MILSRVNVYRCTYLLQSANRMGADADADVDNADAEADA